MDDDHPMKLRRWGATLFAALYLAACTTQTTPTPTASSAPTGATPTPGQSPTSTAGQPTSPTDSAPAPTPTASPSSGAFRTCDYVPGNEVATMPAGVDVPAPNRERTLPDNTVVPVATRAEQLEILDSLADAVPDNYVDPDLGGQDWPALVAEYRDLVEGGYTTDDLETVLNLLVVELGDDHSHVQSDETLREMEESLAGQLDFVGIGVYALPVPDAGRATVLAVFPGSPAEQAGLRPHDSMVSVDGKPVIKPDGSFDVGLVRGLPGSVGRFAMERPAAGPYEVDITRAAINSPLPIGACLVAGTGIAYIMVPCLCDLTIPQQIRDALLAMADERPLTGVVLDNRVNGGGDERALRGILELFVDGNVGRYQAGTTTRQLDIDGEDVAGSQALPVAVLVGSRTASFGEVMSGVLQATDGSVVLGATTDGNVEVLTGYDLAHGWRLWLAHQTFVPSAADYGPWEETGIIPDIEVPTRWDLFSEANDPALAAAVEVLGQP
jgi:carboxyl-terminal processing protease